MILILTDDFDPHADHVERKLRERGAELIRFDPKKLPSQMEMSVAFAATGKVRSGITIGEQHLDLSRVQSIWYRRPNASVADPSIKDPLIRDYVAEECKFFTTDVWNMMECFWLPAPPAVIRKAELKASQLQWAGALGFELPPTLFTNSPNEFLEFYREHKGNVVSKLLSPAFGRFTGTTFNRYTHVVTRRDIAYWRSVRYCPVIFQAYVPKRVELRITVVGQEVFAAEIHSQHSNHTRYDWRRYDQYETPYFPHELPAEIRQRCIRLVEKLGLSYGAIDMVLTPDDRYVFLEINPNGQYLWIEEMTGLPISEAICSRLISDRIVQAAAENVTISAKR